VKSAPKAGLRASIEGWTFQQMGETPVNLLAGRGNHILFLSATYLSTISCMDSPAEKNSFDCPSRIEAI
jgi:hypothetical protein